MVSVTTKDLNLEQIARSGQCFSWQRLPGGWYAIVSGKNYTEARQEGETVLFACTQDRFDRVWRSYFDLDSDYGALKERIEPSDAVLQAAAEKGGGIRILRQDLWEVMVSFLISQNNNIARIRSSVRELYVRYGKCLPVEESMQRPPADHYYTFPGPEELAGATVQEFEGIGLGYRAKYLAVLVEAMRNGKLSQFEQALRESDQELTMQLLTSLYGFGDKVAKCVCLYGLHRMDSFPVDTHIRKILHNYYPEGFPYDRYQGKLGVIQQYLFYYDLKVPNS